MRTRKKRKIERNLEKNKICNGTKRERKQRRQ